MHARTALLFSLFLGCQLLVAQPNIQWQRTFGGEDFDQANCIIQTNDGGFVLAAQTRSKNGDGLGNHGFHDYLIIKLDATGNLVWKKLYGGFFSEIPYDIKQTMDGGFIIAGSTSSEDGDVTGYHGLHDAWIVKLDIAGNLEWQKAYGGTDMEQAYSIQQTTDGGYIFAGVASSEDGDVTGIYGGRDCWVVKIDPTGSIEWQQTLGGSLEDYASAIIQANDGGYVIAGETWSFDGDVSHHNGNTDCWIVKLTPTGVIEWEKTFGGLNADSAHDIIQTQDGGYVFVSFVGSHNTGDVSGHFGLNDYWLVNLSSSGELQWQKCIGGTASDRCFSVVQTEDDGFVLFGNSESVDGDVSNAIGGSDFWLVKTNDLGDVVWEKSYGGSLADVGLKCSPSSDNGLILTGYTTSTDGDLTGTTNKGLNDIWVVKLAPETVAVPELPNRPLALFPNPAAETITFTLPAGMTPTLVQVFNTTGQLVLQQTTTSNNTLNIQTLENGLYQVMASDQLGQQYRATFCKIE